jgi:hypothetical protein
VWSTDVFRDPAREVARVRSLVARTPGAGVPGAGVPGAGTTGAGAAGSGATSDTASQHRPAGSPASRSSGGVRWDVEDAAPGSEAARSSTPSRVGPRPRVPSGLPIDEYSAADLDAVVTWICSDTLLRTHDEVAALTRQQLGFTRRGRRIDEAVDAAIARVRGAQP